MSNTNLRDVKPQSQEGDSIEENVGGAGAGQTRKLSNQQVLSDDQIVSGEMPEEYSDENNGQQQILSSEVIDNGDDQDDENDRNVMNNNQSNQNMNRAPSGQQQLEEDEDEDENPVIMDDQNQYQMQDSQMPASLEESKQQPEGGEDMEGIPDEDEAADEEVQEIVPNLKPPVVPEGGTYITALDEAGVDQERIDALQENINADEFNIFNQYSKEEIDNFKCIFDMFDKDKTKVVNVNDLQTIMKSLNRDPQEAIDLLEELDFDPNGVMSFEEFLRIMKNLENRLVQSKQNEIGDQENMQQMQQDPNSMGMGDGQFDPNIVPREGNLQERNKYGCLLPRTGVHFLPDSKVVDFLRLLNDYRKKCCKEMNLTEARRAALKFEDLKNKEMLRQLQNMKQAQEQELITVESAQRAQFLEFSSAWDNYMSDYEATAYLSLEKLKEKHLLEIQQLHERIRNEYSQKITFTKELMEMRKKVQKLMHSKRYEEAEELNIQCNIKEQEERDNQNDHIEAIIEQQEARLRRKQQMALAALLKRIQRDRNEQLKHRQIDSQRLIQRNKNLLLDLLNKQNMETRRTNQFLRFALGARSPDRKKYFKSKLFYDPNEAKLPMSQQRQQRSQYPAGPNSNSFKALQNHPLSREGGQRSGGQNEMVSDMQEQNQ